MPDTIVPARRGTNVVNTALDELAAETGWLTTDELAELIAIETITGTADTVDSGPVGTWVVGELAARGLPAFTYSWVGTLVVYGPARLVLGEVRLPEGHTLHELECEVNDGDRAELLHQGETDPR